MQFLKQVLILMASSFSLYSAPALACGGADLTDEQILNSAELSAVVEKIYQTYGKKVGVEEILRTEHRLLDMDRVEVASAMCAANYHHVYMATSTPQELRCLVVFEPNPFDKGQIKSDTGKFLASCIPAGGKRERVTVPFFKDF